MATRVASPHRQQGERGASALWSALLACGVAYPLAYIVANDVVAAAIYDGYSRVDQAISELSATEAPSKAFLTAMLPVFTLLLIGFGIGVWGAARRGAALRVTGWLLIAQGALFPLWLLFPMTSREEMVEGATTTNDVGHLALGALAVLFILAQIGSSAMALGKRFRLFALAMAATVLLCGGLTAVLSSDIASGDPTPWTGLVERLSYGSWLLWMAALALVLLRRRKGAANAMTPEPPAAPPRTG
jgi:hypothetical protein